MVHCYERGSDIIVGDRSHLNLWEQGGLSQVLEIDLIFCEAIFFAIFNNRTNFFFLNLLIIGGEHIRKANREPK
jgi:hypothetical protein